MASQIFHSSSSNNKDIDDNDLCSIRTDQTTLPSSNVRRVTMSPNTIPAPEATTTTTMEETIEDLRKVMARRSGKGADLFESLLEIPPDHLSSVVDVLVASKSFSSDNDAEIFEKVMKEVVKCLGDDRREQMGELLRGMVAELKGQFPPKPASHIHIDDSNSADHSDLTANSANRNQQDGAGALGEDLGALALDNDQQPAIQAGGIRAADHDGDSSQLEGVHFVEEDSLIYSISTDGAVNKNAKNLRR